MKRILFLIIVSMGVFFNPAAALERFDILSTQEIKQMLQDRNENKIEFLLINTLDEIIYRNVSIPGSVNVPWSRVQEKVDVLGPDKEKMMVTY